MIQIIPLGNFSEKFKPISLEVNSFKQLLAALQTIYRENFIEFSKLKLKYVLKLKDKDEFLPVDLTTVDILLEGFETCYIIEEIEGNIVAPMVISAFAAIAPGVSISLTTATIIAAVANIAIGMAVSAIVQAITPTPTIKNDPGTFQSKHSSLFNGAVNTTNQGCAVPLIFGAPFCGGVLISFGIYSEEV